MPRDYFLLSQLLCNNYGTITPNVLKQDQDKEETYFSQKCTLQQTTNRATFAVTLVANCDPAYSISGPVLWCIALPSLKESLKL